MPRANFTFSLSTTSSSLLDELVKVRGVKSRSALVRWMIRYHARKEGLLEER